jgi:acylphosphatase
MKRAHALIAGKVQGVNFRYYTTEKALQLEVKGWVKNLSDGRVEILVEGEDEAADELIAWSHQGPPLAQVQSVVVTEEPFQGDLDNFHTRR